MSEAKVSNEASDSLLYALGVSFSEREGVKDPDTLLVQANGGTCASLYAEAYIVITTAAKP